MALDSPGTGAPLFRRIADALTDAIGRGEYPVGAHLPPEFTLGRMFGCQPLHHPRGFGGASQAWAGGQPPRLRHGGPAPRTTACRCSARATVPSTNFSRVSTEAPLEALEITNVIADEELAAELRCEPGRQFLMLRGIRRSRARPDAPPMALTDAYINASYGAIRSHLASLTGSIASTAEKFLGVRVQSIAQELEPMVLDVEQAASLSAEVGSPAMLVQALVLPRRRGYPVDQQVGVSAGASAVPQCTKTRPSAGQRVIPGHYE